ncbi:MAG TPA: universal stress protein [Stellaceae bacterium]|nr:universal stress protein [Stellaceae bacterium]
MPLKDLLLHLDASTQGTRRLDYALQLAVRENAHLIGLYTLDLVPALSELARTLPGRIANVETYIQIRNAELARARQTEAYFRDGLRHQGVEGEWRLVEALAAETVALQARYADLAIIGQVDPENRPSTTADRIPEEVLLHSGRPLVIIPYAGTFPTVAQNVLVAWKPTAEAARAIGDALPLLQSAKKVTVVTVNPERGSDTEPGIPVADISLHLARHDIRVEGATTVADDIATADVLLNQVADIGADFLVMGGYGHPRAREVMFGGVTRQILSQMTVPVLMAH